MDEYLERPHARIAFSSTGPADAERSVVVVHSLATSRRWEQEAGVFDWAPIAAAGHRVVQLDSRGHGGSSGNTAAEEYRWPALAQDLVAVADAVSPDRRIDALGESTGCGVLLWAVLAAPRRFRRLVLVVPPTEGRARAHQAELYRGAADMIELRGAEAWQRLLATAVQPPILQRGGWTRPTWLPIAEDLIPAVLRGAADSDLPDDDALRTIDQPALILTWDTDPSHPVSAARDLAARLPNSVLEVGTEPDDVRGWGARAAAFLADA